MKTPDEIKKDALALIRQTHASYRQLSKALCGKENATLEEVLQAVEQVKNPFVDGVDGGKMRLDVYLHSIKSKLKYAEEERDVRSKLAIERFQRIGELERELEAVKRERDAAVKDLKAACKLLWDDCMQCCKFCERKNDPKDTGYCDKCNNGNRFKFKPAALCPENTKEDNA